MQLLFLSNFYPPLGRGGYEEWCREVAEGLRARGHEVHVLTSRHARKQAATDPSWVHRDLHLEMALEPLRHSINFFLYRGAHERANHNTLRRWVRDLNPDAIVIWGMWNLHRSLAALAEKLLPRRVVYYLGDYWPTLPSQHESYWQTTGRHPASRFVKRLLRDLAQPILEREYTVPLTFEHALFPSAFLRDELTRQGLRFRRTRVIYGGVDTTPYLNSSRPSEGDGEYLSLLYVGRLTPEKGPHTAIEALGYLAGRHRLRGARLTLVGSGSPEYEAELREVAAQYGVDSLVTFLGHQPREAMPALYRQAGALLFTSLWEEPFGRVLVEAMAAGVVVVGSLTGGAAEILIPDETALTFPPGDAAALAEQVARLAHTPALRRHLVARARELACRRFDIGRMVREIETYLRMTTA